MSDVLAVAEHRQGELRDVSFELVTAGADLTEETGGSLHVAVVGGDAETFGSELNLAGVDTVHAVAAGDEFNHDVQVQAVAQLVDAVEPSYLLLPHTANGLDYAPAAADRLDRPLVTDVTAIDGVDPLSVTREEFGSKVATTYEVDADDVVLTLRPTEWSVATEAGDAAVESVDLDVDDSAVGSTVTGFEEAAGGDVDISEAEFIVSIGRGIDEEENLDLIEELCEATGATLASSRPIVDNGWLPQNRQVGQSGKTVTPDVYVAIGISGAVQHVAGMKSADTIVAVNTDPNAPIFDIADYGIVDDLFEVVPALIEQFE